MTTLPTPYYDDGNGIVIYHGDARDILPLLPKASIDVVLTDPPFFMPATHYQSRTKHQRAWGDTSILATFWSAILDAALPAMKPSGHFVTFCDGQSYPVFYPEMYRRFDALACLVWDKEHFGMGRVWRKQHELVIAGRWESSVFPDENGSRSDVIRARATNAADRDHPVEKPLSVLRHILGPTSKSGDLILDPFMGGGSTIQAAQTMGRKAIGIEIEEHYCRAAVQRLQQSVMQFDEPATRANRLTEVA